MPANITTNLGIQQDPVSQTGPVEYWNAYDITGVAEGGNVTSWPGRNGNAATLAAAQAINASYVAPTFSSGGMGGSPSINCAGSSMLATAASLVSGNYANFTVVIVLWPKSTSSTNGYYVFQIGGPAGNNKLGGAFNLGGVIAEIEFLNLNGICVGEKHRVSAGVASGSARPLIAFYTYDGTKTYQAQQGMTTFWVDGACVDAEPCGAATQALSGQVQIGNLGIGDLLNFNIGALAFWNRTLTPPEIRKINAYLSDTFLRDYRKRCFVIGDSIGEGTVQSANQTIVDQLQVAMPELRFINAARGGHSLAEQSGGQPPYDNLVNSIRTNDLVLMMPGNIDIGNNGTIPATVEGYHTSIVAACKAQGAYVIQCEMIPKQANTDNISQASSDTNRATYNTWIDTVSNSGADAFVGLASLAGFNSNTSWQSTTNYVTIVNSITGVNATGGAQNIALANFGFRLQRVASVIKVSDSSDQSAFFESILSSDGNIKQTSGNLAGVALTVTVNDGTHVTSTGTATWVSSIKTALKPFSSS